MDTNELDELPKMPYDNKPTLHSSQIDMAFFTTNEKYLNALDNDEILEFVQLKYPNIQVNNADLLIKKTIIELLNDKTFMTYTLNRFSINIYDFFKIFYKDYSNLFKGAFLKKIRNSLIINSFISNDF